MKKPVALFLACLFTAACIKQTLSIAPFDTDQVRRARTVEVTTVDGRTVTLSEAAIKNGRLSGRTADGGAVAFDRAEVKSAKATIVRRNYFLLIIYGGFLAVEVALTHRARTAPPRPPASEIHCCPFIFSWNGSAFVFEAEPYGGAITRSMARTDWIPLEQLQETGGSYRLMMTNELAETEHTDELKLVVVDHAPGLRVLPDASGRLHAIGAPLPPLSVADGRGRDVRDALASRDGAFWESAPVPASTSDEALRDSLILEFPKPPGARAVRLVADAWTTVQGSAAAKDLLENLGTGTAAFFAEVDARGPAYAKLMGWYAREELYLLKVEAETPQGWKPRAVIYGGGPYVAKEKAYSLDVSDIPGDRLRLRLRPPAGFWRFDSLLLDASDPHPVRVLEVAPSSARTDDGRDVAASLEATDGNFHLMPPAAGGVELVFPAPPSEPGSARSIILKAGGYYDIHLSGSGTPRPDIVDRILTERGYALRLVWDRWLAASGAKADAR